MFKFIYALFRIQIQEFFVKSCSQKKQEPCAPFPRKDLGHEHFKIDRAILICIKGAPAAAQSKHFFGVSLKKQEHAFAL